MKTTTRFSISALLSLLAVVASASAFLQPSCAGRIGATSYRQQQVSRVSLFKSKILLYSSSEEEHAKGEATSTSTANEDDSPLSPVETGNTVVSEPVSTAVEEAMDVPIDVPSPLLLASSIILAIVSVGSLFDLLGGNPAFGFAPTAATALAGVPICGFLFYAAIKKGQAETEEDDRNFRGGR